MVPVTFMMPVPMPWDVIVVVVMRHEPARVVIPMAGVVPTMMTMVAVMAMVTTVISAAKAAAVMAEIDPRAFIEPAVVAVVPMPAPVDPPNNPMVGFGGSGPRNRQHGCRDEQRTESHLSVPIHSFECVLQA
jgi:hypothetical protein